MAIKVRFRQATVEPAVIPTLRIDVYLISDRPIYVMVLTAEASIQTSNGWISLGEAHCYDHPLFLTISGQREAIASTRFYLELDPFRLERIEQLRGNGDIYLRIKANYCTFDPSESLHLGVNPTVNLESFYIEQEPNSGFKIPKSDWVEQFLPKLGYKKVRLLEIPILEAPTELNELVIHIDEAWEHFSMGNYEEVLTSCRKGLEIIERYLINNGYKKTIEVKGEPKTVADWKAFLGSSVGEDVEKIFDGLKHFTSVGAHAGRVISRAEAEYALMCMHGISSYFLKMIRVSGSTLPS